MQNVTYAGPDRGLLDVLFGTGKAEEKSEGGDFGNLMNLIKSLNAKEEDSRTDQETVPGKGGVDYLAVGMPGFLNLAQPGQVAAAAEKDAEGVTAEAAASVMANLMPAPQPQLPTTEAMPSLETVDAGRVNGMLKEKSLQPLTSAEMDLLQRVNEKVAELNEETQAGQPSRAMQQLLSEVQAANEGMNGPEAEMPAMTQAETQFVSELNRRGVDAQAIRGDEAAKPASEAPLKGADKFVSTESYLQMHTQTQGSAPKGKDAAKADVTEGDPRNVAQAAPKRVSVEAVAEKGAKAKDLFSGLGRDSQVAGKDGDEKKGDAAAPFSHDLLQSLKSGSGEGNVKEVFLNGTNPQALRSGLVGEVNQQVSLTALKGGGEMRLVIRPDGLGEVKLKVEAKDGKVGVHVTAENEEVAKALKSGSHDLESSLRDQNLSLAKFEVAVKSDAPVASTDTRSNLSDQFLGSNRDQGGFDQNFQGFNQGRHDEGRFGSWDGQQRQPSPGRMADDTGVNQRGYAAARKGNSPANQAARDGSRRLDVVA